MIGLSYYPHWHGTLEDLENNLTDLAERYHKPMMIAETAMAFTYEAHQLKNDAAPETAPDHKPLAASAKLGKDLPWPGTPEGQLAFLKDLAAVLRRIPEELCKGFIWWEAAWIPVPGSGWASPAALEYLHEKGPGGNEWANMALFGYEGNALPALKALGQL